MWAGATLWQQISMRSAWVLSMSPSIVIAITAKLHKLSIMSPGQPLLK